MLDFFNWKMGEKKQKWYSWGCLCTQPLALWITAPPRCCEVLNCVDTWPQSWQSVISQLEGLTDLSICWWIHRSYTDGADKILILFFSFFLFSFYLSSNMGVPLITNACLLHKPLLHCHPKCQRVQNRTGVCKEEGVAEGGWGWGGLNKALWLSTWFA